MVNKIENKKIALYRNANGKSRAFSNNQLPHDSNNWTFVKNLPYVRGKTESESIKFFNTMLAANSKLAQYELPLEIAIVDKLPVIDRPPPKHYSGARADLELAGLE